MLYGLARANGQTYCCLAINIKGQKMISIIIPVYNAEKYLKTTVGSILAQTYKDFELLLVDDGSTDSSLQICQSFSDQDSRVRVLHKFNGGVSSARNFGLQNAKGEFVTFCDNDDYFYPDYLEVMHNGINRFDVIICNYAECDNRSKINEFIPKKIKESLNSIDIKEEKDFSKFWPSFDDTCIGQIWRQMFRMSIIKDNNLRFDGLGYEDSLFTYEYYLHIASAKRIDYTGYIHITSESSQSLSHKLILETTRIRRLERLHADFINKHNINNTSYNNILLNRYMFLAATFILKGYYKDTRVNQGRRLQNWEEVRQDTWFNKLHFSSIKETRSIIFFVFCKLHLERIVDPILIAFFNFHNLLFR